MIDEKINFYFSEHCFHIPEYVVKVKEQDDSIKKNEFYEKIKLILNAIEEMDHVNAIAEFVVQFRKLLIEEQELWFKFME